MLKKTLKSLQFKFIKHIFFKATTLKRRIPKYRLKRNFLPLRRTFAAIRGSVIFLPSFMLKKSNIEMNCFFYLLFCVNVDECKFDVKTLFAHLSLSLANVYIIYFKYIKR